MTSMGCSSCQHDLHSMKIISTGLQVNRRGLKVTLTSEIKAATMIRCKRRLKLSAAGLATVTANYDNQRLGVFRHLFLNVMN